MEWTRVIGQLAANGRHIYLHNQGMKGVLTFQMDRAPKSHEFLGENLYLLLRLQNAYYAQDLRIPWVKSLAEAYRTCMRLHFPKLVLIRS